MTRLLIASIIFVLAGVGLFAQCTCHKTEKGENTHWGGNELIVLVEEKSYKELRGIVLDHQRDPMPGALIEVFTNPDCLLRHGPQTAEEKAKQKRIKARGVGPDGSFASAPNPANMKCVPV